MDDGKLCILCSGKLIKGPTEEGKYNFDLIYQQCENCKAYGYWKNEEQKIKETIKDNSKKRDTLLSIAREQVKDTTPLKTPIIKL